MITDERYRTEIKKERKRIFFRLYGIPVFLLCIMSLILFFINLHLFYNLDSKEFEKDSKGIIVNFSDIEKEKEILNKLEEKGYGEYILINHRTDKNHLLWEGDDGGVRIGFKLYEVNEKIEKIISRNSEIGKSPSERIKEIYEEVGYEKFSEIILDYKIKEREYTFGIGDWILKERLKIPLEENIIGYNRIYIGKEIERLRLEGVDISILVENLIKKESQEGIEKAFDGFETYKKVYE